MIHTVDTLEAHEGVYTCILRINIDILIYLYIYRMLVYILIYIYIYIYMLVYVSATAPFDANRHGGKKELKILAIEKNATTEHTRRREP